MKWVNRTAYTSSFSLFHVSLHVSLTEIKEILEIKFNIDLTCLKFNTSQLTFTCSNMETPEQCVKPVQI